MVRSGEASADTRTAARKRGGWSQCGPCSTCQQEMKKVCQSCTINARARHTECAGGRTCNITADMCRQAGRDMCEACIGAVGACCTRCRSTFCGESTTEGKRRRQQQRQNTEDTSEKEESDEAETEANGRRREHTAEASSSSRQTKPKRTCGEPVGDNAEARPMRKRKNSRDGRTAGEARPRAKTNPNEASSSTAEGSEQRQDGGTQPQPRKRARSPGQRWQRERLRLGARSPHRARSPRRLRTDGA